MELRRQAWELYRNSTGLPKGHKLPKVGKAGGVQR